MLSMLELMIIKESLGGHDIIYLNICNQEFVFRTLGVKEYKDILTCVSVDKDIEDAICQTAIVYPENYKFGDCPFAGIIPIAASKIKEASGVNNMDMIMDRMNEKKEEMNSFYNQCVNLIKAVFNEYTYNEIAEWPWVKIIDYAVRAESILNIKGIPVKLVDQRGLEDDEDDVEVEPTRDEIAKELREYGIDPMNHFIEDYINKDRNIVDYPLIGGIHWNREDIIGAIRDQMVKK